MVFVVIATSTTGDGESSQGGETGGGVCCTGGAIVTAGAIGVGGAAGVARGVGGGSFTVGTDAVTAGLLPCLLLRILSSRARAAAGPVALVATDGDRVDVAVGLLALVVAVGECGALAACVRWRARWLG